MRTRINIIWNMLDSRAFDSTLDTRIYYGEYDASLLLFDGQLTMNDLRISFFSSQYMLMNNIACFLHIRMLECEMSDAATGDISHSMMEFILNVFFSH